MQGHQVHAVAVKWLAALVVLVITDSTALHAQPAGKMVYNPMTGRSQPEVRPGRRPADTRPAPRKPSASAAAATRQAKQTAERKPTSDKVDSAVQQASYESEVYYDSSVPECGCEDPCTGCGDISCGDPCCGDVVTCSPLTPCIYAGFQAVFVKPRFEDNVAFTVRESDGASFDTLTDTEFDYDMEFSPRVFLGWQRANGIGMRVSWWQFDHSPGAESANPPANGFGEITHPPFGDVDISSNIPTDTFSAASDLNAYALDLEATKQVNFPSWQLGIGGGVRYALAEQSYNAQLRNTGGVLRGDIDYSHSIEGIGPTISLNAYRPWTPQFGGFCNARGSVLFGDGESQLEAGEDLDLANSFTTTRATRRDDLLSIAELQVGVLWQGALTRGRLLTPFASAAMEGQVWEGAGNATSEEGSLGFFGFSCGAGVNW